MRATLVGGAEGGCLVFGGLRPGEQDVDLMAHAGKACAESQLHGYLRQQRGYSPPRDAGAALTAIARGIVAWAPWSATLVTSLSPTGGRLDVAVLRPRSDRAVRRRAAAA